ncbi:MAG: glycosyltransferase family 39 protein [Armatimonadota bacterium]
MGVIAFIIIAVAALLFGARIPGWLNLRLQSRWALALTGLGLGMVSVAYAILVFGLLGHLTIIPIAAAVAVMIIAGASMWRLVPDCLNSAARYIRSLWYSGPGYRALLIFFALWVLLTLAGALIPPASADYDGLSQHLAQAWTYAHEHSLVTLWYDHHSQFPATMQMLFTAGMLVDGYITARLLNWLTALVCIVWVVLLTRRFLASDDDTRAAPWAAFVLMTIPAFNFLTGVTYVDLAVASFGLGALYFFLAWYHDRQPGSLLLMALMLGGGMTVKMQILVLAGCLTIAAIVVGVKRKMGRQVVLAVVAMIVVGGPWYVKSYIITGNPVYPFAYEIFDGRHWSQEQADKYERHQMEFGVGELPSQAEMEQMPWWKRRLVGPRAPHRWLLGPVLLTIRPSEFLVGSSPAQSFLTEWVGPLLLPLLLLLVVWRRPPPLRTILWLFLPLWFWWFFSMQYTRYLLPSLVLLCPALGYSLWRCVTRGPVIRAAAGTVAGIWGVTALLPLLLNIAAAAPAITGQITWQQYLTGNLDVYEPSRYISEYLPEDAVIATYGEPRYYYFQRRALWADPGHSQLFNYRQMQDPADLLQRYRDLGVTHVLINRIYTGGGPGQSNAPEMELIQRAMEEGHLRRVTVFPRRTQYLLLAVQPAPTDGS